jgi:hypothetical protein
MNGEAHAVSTVIKLIFEGSPPKGLPHSHSCVGSYLGLGIAGWIPHNVYREFSVPCCASTFTSRFIGGPKMF